MKSATQLDTYSIIHSSVSLRFVVSLGLAAALAPLGSTMIAVALPEIGKRFHTDPSTLTQLLVTGYLLAAIVSQSPGGKIGDLWGHHRALAIGQTIFAIGTVAGFLSPNLFILVIGRILMAVGGAAMVPSAIALLRNLIPTDMRSRAFGAFGSMMALSAAVGPLVGGELVVHFGWRSIFIANLPVLGLSVFMARDGRETAHSRKLSPRFDFLGSILLCAGLTLLVIGLKSRGAEAIIIFMVAGLLCSVFYLWEKRVDEPVIDPLLFQQHVFTAGTLVVAFHNLVMYALLFQLPYFFAQIRNSDSSKTGRMLLSLMMMMFIFSIVGGWVAERIGFRFSAMLGALIALTGVILLYLNDLMTPGDAIPPLMLVGMGLGLSMAPSNAAAVSAAAVADSGMAAGVLSTMRYIGGVVGTAVLAILLTAKQPDAAIIQHHAAIVIFAIALGTSALITIALPGKAKRPIRKLA